jgi:hypothetical protein
MNKRINHGQFIDVYDYKAIIDLDANKVSNNKIVSKKEKTKEKVYVKKNMKRIK